MVCSIYEGDLPPKLAKVVQNGQVSDKEIAGTDKQPMPGRHWNQPTKARKYEAAYIKYGFIAI